MPDPLPLDGPGAQVRLLEGVAAVIGAACEGPQPGVVLLDDVHAADEATLDAISYLGHRLRGRPLLLVVELAQRGGAPRASASPPGGGPGPRRKGGDREPRPARARTRSRSSCEAVQPEAARAGARAPRVSRERGPAAVRGRVPRGAATRAAMPAQEPAAPEVRGLLEARLGGLGDVARQVLGAAAAIGRSFDLDTVRQASGRSEEETVGALEELVAHGVVREVPGAEPVYDFSHQKLRTLVYEQTGLARRRLLHGRVAAAMSSAAPGGESAALVAQHLRLAGDDAAQRSATPRGGARGVAARSRRRARAPRGGAGPGLSRTPPICTSASATCARCVGDYAARSRATRAPPPSARRRRSRRSSTSSAACTAGAASGSARRRRLLAALDAAARGAAWAAGAHPGRPRPHAASGRPTRATRRTRTRGARARRRRRRPAGAGAGTQHARRARPERRGAAAARSRSSSAACDWPSELGDAPAQAAALNNLALVERDAGELEARSTLTESALELCAAYGDRHREAALENNLADLHHAAGHDDEAMVHLKRAVAIFTEVGADEATRLPEIWKLVSW